MLRTHSLDTLPYYLTAGPDSHLLDMSIPVGTIAENGKSLTRADLWMTRAASGIAPTFAAYGLIAGGILLHDYLPVVGDESSSDLVRTRKGRSAALQTASGAWGVSLLTAAMRQSRHAPEVANATTRLGKVGNTILGAGATDVMLNPKLVKVGILSGALVAANQFGYFDFLNRDDPRSTGQKFGDAVHSTWVLNDPVLRPTVTAAIGGLGLANAATTFLPAMREGGGLTAAGIAKGFAEVPKGKLAIAGGLLALAGVSALGGLDFLNKED
jgi:hypothetical protein